MVRQDAHVQHVRVAQHQMRTFTDRAARILRRVAVVGKRADRGVLLQPLGQRQQLGQLVLGQRLGREQIERACRRIAQDGTEHRRVVAEGLARCGRRDRDDVTALQRVGHRLRLMHVGSSDAPRGKRGTEPVIDRVRVVGELRRLGGKPTPRGDDRPRAWCGDGSARRPVDIGCSGRDEPLQRLEQRGIPLPVGQGGQVRRTGQTESWCPTHGR